jgi:hypothetical protein
MNRGCQSLDSEAYVFRKAGEDYNIHIAGFFDIVNSGDRNLFHLIIMDTNKIIRGG